MRTLASRAVFFLGALGWGDGDSQVCRRRRRAPRDGRWPRFRTIDSFPDGLFPRSSKSSPGGSKSSKNALRAIPRSSKSANTLCISLIFAFFNPKLMPVSSENYEKTPLSSEIGFATGHSPELQKQPRRLQKCKNRMFFIYFYIF